MENETTPICIDNTNITKAEMKPYVELVNSYFDFSLVINYFCRKCLIFSKRLIY